MKHRFAVFISILALACTGLWLNLSQQPQADCPLTFEETKHHKHARALSERIFEARDGHNIFYRYLPNRHSDQLIVLLHGSSYHGTYLIPLAERLARHANVCIPDVRGHGRSAPPFGTCSYLGQLEDDLADLLEHLPQKYAHVTFIGHSSGGGLAIRFAAGPYKHLVNQLVLLSPAIVTAPTMNTPGARAWTQVHKITLAELVAMNALGITRFNTRTILTINKPKELCDGSETLSYDYNLAVSMHPRIPYKKDCGIAAPKTHVIIGEQDEINNPYAFEKIFPAERITILPGVAHLDIVTAPEAWATIEKHLPRQTSP